MLRGSFAITLTVRGDLGGPGDRMVTVRRHVSVRSLVPALNVGVGLFMLFWGDSLFLVISDGKDVRHELSFTIVLLLEGGNSRKVPFLRALP